MAGKTKKIEKPTWLKMKEEDLKKVIAELYEKYQQAQIGLILRDQYGVTTTKVYGKKLSIYLKELGYDGKAELRNLEKKVDKMKEHLKKNITDKRSKHKMQKAQSRLNIKQKYYARK